MVSQLRGRSSAGKALRDRCNFRWSRRSNQMHLRDHNMLPESLENYVSCSRCLLDSVHGNSSHRMPINGAPVTWLTPDREKLVEGKISMGCVDLNMDGS